jgi:hypothetical protein
MQVELRAVAVQQNRAERRRLVKGKMTVYFEGIKKKKKVSSKEEGLEKCCERLIASGA